MMRRTLSTLLLPALALAPSIAPAAKTRIVPPPPYSGAYQPQTVDERGLWGEVDEMERTLQDSPAVLRDVALNAYLRQVLCDTVGADRCAGVRIYVLRVPHANANMAPNGSMQIWTGMLLRVRNEAELAAILAHEFAHFEKRHTLAAFKAHRTTGDIAMWVGLAGAYAGTATGSTQLSLYGTLYSYQRDQERSADIHGFQYLAGSRYRPGAFSEFWQRMMDEADATAFGRQQRSTRYDRTAFFATHPTDLERAGYLKQLAVRDGDDGDDGVTTFAAAMQKWRPLFLADQLKRNDFGGSEYLLAQLAGTGWTPDLLFARGELYRMRGNPRDLVAAADFYRAAIAGGTVDPLAHRGLGLALMRTGRPAEAKVALATYLVAQPDCEDAALLRSLIEQP
ncbi:M48 family metallopeptidase [Sphingomonas montana]|uniref:M48 family metallopeptidase n=1 Tax=Sphingomonas montana TaxID=1843236 RepID=UPI001F0A52EE|nr:M48 family metallopeptidase [Sphingomonas montana]